MTQIPLYRHGDRDKTPVKELLTASSWMRAMEPFPLNVRYHAANLAAHNWDVVIVGDRLLVACAWSGGDWFSTTGERTAITEAEWDEFYPRVETVSAGGRIMKLTLTQGEVQ